MISEEYLATFQSMQRAKVSAALERQMRLDGVYMFRWQVAEKLANSASLRIDDARGRLYHKRYDGDVETFYDVRAITASAARYAVWLRDNKR